MASLTNSTIANTYTMLLKMADTGIDGTLNKIESGDADDGALALSTTAIGIDTTDKMHFDGIDGAFGASNTYIHEAAADRLDFVVGGDTNGFVLLESGGTTNVGIGTAAPQKELHINSTTGQARIQLSVTSASNITQSQGLGGIFMGGTDDNGTEDLDTARILFEVPDSASGGTDWSASTKDTDISFYTQDATTLGERMRIKFNGNVGIGTTTPNRKFVVYDTSAAILQITESTGVAADKGMYLQQDGVDSFMINQEAGDMFFGVNNSTDMTILDGGNVGIGIATPANKLEIFGDSGDGSAIDLLKLSNPNASAGAESGLLFRIYDQEGAIRVERGAGDGGTDMHFLTDNTGGALTERLTLLESGNVGIGDTSPSYILDIAGDLSGASQIARIQGVDLDANSEYAVVQASANRSGGGSVRIAEIGSYNNTAVGATAGYLAIQAHDGVAAYIWLDEDDDLQVSNSPAHIGTTSGQEIHDDITTSDERLKDISSDVFPYGLSDINKLIPIRFKYKNKSKNDWKLGLGAQTTQPIVPETVLDTDICIDGYEYDPDDYHKATPKSDDTKLRMSYSQFIPILIKAIQELSTKVTALENA